MKIVYQQTVAVQTCGAATLPAGWRHVGASARDVVAGPHPADAVLPVAPAGPAAKPLPTAIASKRAGGFRTEKLQHDQMNRTNGTTGSPSWRPPA